MSHLSTMTASQTWSVQWLTANAIHSCHTRHLHLVYLGLSCREADLPETPGLPFPFTSPWAPLGKAQNALKLAKRQIYFGIYAMNIKPHFHYLKVKQGTLHVIILTFKVIVARFKVIAIINFMALNLKSKSWLYILWIWILIWSLLSHNNDFKFDHWDFESWIMTLNLKVKIITSNLIITIYHVPFFTTPIYGNWLP